MPALLARSRSAWPSSPRGHGPVLAEHAGATIAAGGKRLRPLLVLLAAGRAPDDPRELARARAAAVELVHSRDARPRRRARRRARCAAACRPCGRRAVAPDRGRHRRPAVLARVRRARRATGTLAVRARAVAGDVGARRGRAAAARGRLERRGRAVERYLLSLRAEDRAPVRGGVRARRAARPGAPSAEVAALGAFGRRIGLAFQLLDDVLDVSGPAERHRQAPRHRPARRHGHAAADPRARARRRRWRDGPARDHDAASRRRRCASASRRRARWPTRGRRRWRSSSRPRSELAALELEDGQRLALDLVADSVVDRLRLRRRAERRGLEVLGQDVPGGDRADEALDVLFHVGAGELAQVGDERLGAAVQLVVEALDRVFLEDVRDRPLAVRAAQADLPAGAAGLVPRRPGRRAPTCTRGRRGARRSDRRGSARTR